MALLIPTAIAMAVLEGMSWFDILYYKEVYEIQNAIAYIAVILVTFMTAAATFSIEHERQSFQFLRSLPFSSRRIVAIKMQAAAGLSLLTALLFWPLSWRSGGPALSLHYWFIVVVAIVSLYLWCIYFSMTSKTVVSAIGKAAIGFGITTAIPSIAFFIDVTYETLFWSLEYCLKSISIVALTVLIAGKSKTWCDDSQEKARKSRWFAFPIYEIHSIASVKFASPFWRLIWLQRRTGVQVIVIAIAVHCSLWLIVFNTFPGTSALQRFSKIAFCLIASMGIVGSGIFTGIQSSRSMLSQHNFRPSVIWVSQLVLPFSVCMIAGLVTDFFDYPVPNRLLFFTETMLIGLAIGQMFSLICRSYVLALTFTFVFSYLAFLVHEYFGAYVREAWPTWVCLIGLPFASTFILRRKWLFEQSFRGVLLPTLWGFAALALVQYPISRVMEFSPVSDDQVLTQLLETKDVEWIKLHQLRNLVDRRQLSPNAYDSIEKILDQYDGGELLLTHAQPNKLDFYRFRQVEGKLREAISNESDSSDRAHALKLRLLNRWPGSIKLPGSRSNPENLFASAIRLAQDSRTSAEEIRKLISSFENEDRFESYRYVIASQYFNLVQTAGSSLYYSSLYHSKERSSFYKIFFWERARERRAANLIAINAIKQIDELKRSHERFETRSEWEKRPWSSTLPITKEYPDLSMSGFAESHHWNLMQQRMIRLALAIVLWKKEHNGAYPDSLEQLVGSCLQEIPNNPFSKTPICYAPIGVPADVIKQNGATRSLYDQGRGADRSYDGRRVADQPFIWLNTSGDKDAITTVEGLEKDNKSSWNQIVFLIPRMHHEPANEPNAQ